MPILQYTVTPFRLTNAPKTDEYCTSGYQVYLDDLVAYSGKTTSVSKHHFVLQAKPERTAEENDRLRKLMLEWQFQKRLQESKQSDDEEDEEDDEDVDTVMIMQRLEAEKRARVRNGRKWLRGKNEFIWRK